MNGAGIEEIRQNIHSLYREQGAMQDVGRLTATITIRQLGQILDTLADLQKRVTELEAKQTA